MQSRGVTERERGAGGAAPGWREGGEEKAAQKQRESKIKREREREILSYLILSYRWRDR
jgi:hypothetical protein